MQTTEDQLTPELADKWRYYITERSYYEINVEGQTVKIPMPHDIVDEKISRMHDRILYASPKTKKQKRKFARLSRSISAKTAAIILLNRLYYVPFLFAIYWRWLRFSKTPKYISAIVNCGFIKDTELFFSLNCTTIKNHCEYLLIEKQMAPK